MRFIKKINGTFIEILMDFNFQRKRMDTIPEERKLEALENAAEHFKYIEFSWRDLPKLHQSVPVQSRRISAAGKKRSQH
jgi:hypothetical protein